MNGTSLRKHTWSVGLNVRKYELTYLDLQTSHVSISNFSSKILDYTSISGRTIDYLL